MFSHYKLLEASLSAINLFASQHQDETFYGFSVDADMLCFNSVEKFAKILEHYQSKYPGRYSDESIITELRNNTGDWAYQGFFVLKEDNGFDCSLYSEHYEDPKPESEYAVAMKNLISALNSLGAFNNLHKTNDFQAKLSDHNY